MHEETNLPRTSVPRPSDVQGQIHSREQHQGGDNARLGADKSGTRPSRISGHADMLRVLVEKNKRDVADFNEVHDGYKALVKDYVSILLELSVARDEPVRWPLNLPERVVIDIQDEFMNGEPT